MKWASAISTRASLEMAIREVTAQVAHQLPESPDLAVVFISSAFASEYSRVLPLLQDAIATPFVIGCGGSGVIGTRQDGSASEVEEKAALSLSVGKLPGVSLHPFHIATDDLPDLDSPPNAWIDLIGVSPADNPHFIIIADPFSSKLNDLLQGLDFAYPGAIKIGGLAGIDSFSRSSGLFCGTQLHAEGLVGMAMCGPLVIDTIVAQGCRPIGETYRVIEGDRNVITKIELQSDDPLSSAKVETPLEALQLVFADLNEQERELAQRALFIGVAQSGFKETLERGDFLIRNLVGVDPRIGAIAIADKVRIGQRIQFHLRDQQAAIDDLELVLRRYSRHGSERSSSPTGALMFTCNGRGTGLYGEPDYDSKLLQQFVGPIPVGGFFCSGEIGPVGQSTFLHGFTSVFGIFRAKI
jgi:small ligand-binding sensory domain FIST